MPISRSDFEVAHQAMLGRLPQRILHLCQGSRDALSVRDVAARILGIRGRYLPLLAPEIAEAAPTVQMVLDQLVSAGKLHSTVLSRPPLYDPETYYLAVAQIGDAE